MKKPIFVVAALLAAAITSCAQVRITGHVTVKGNVVGRVSSTVVVPADYYVAPPTGITVAPCTNGSDSNDGKAPALGGGHGPFASLDHARSVVRASALLGGKPLTIAFCGGNYYGQSSTFTNMDSGSSTNPVTYKNYPGQTPVLSGGSVLTGWTNITGNAICNGNTNCWQISINPSSPYFEALYYNGVRRARPRSGATAGHTFDVSYGVYGGACQPTGTPNPGCPASPSFQYTAGDPDMSGAAAWTGNATQAADIILYDQEKWVMNILRGIASINTSTHVVTTTCTVGSGGNGKCPQKDNPGAWRPDNTYVFENVKQLLRFAGQWYLDRSTSPNWTLTYLGNPGENPNVDTVVVGNQAQVINATSWSNWAISGLTILNDNYTVAPGGYQSIQLDPFFNYTHSNTNAQASGIVSCKSCTNFTFGPGNVIGQTTASGIQIFGTSTNGTITSNLIYDIGAYGIAIGSSPVGSDTNATVTQFINVTNNRVVGTGRFLPTADGIMLGDVHDIDVGFNDVGYTYHDAVEICKPAGGFCGGSNPGTNPTQSFGAFNITVHDNDLHNILQGITNDGAGIYRVTIYDCGAGTACAGTGKSNTGNKATHNSIHDVNDESAQNFNNSSWGKNGYGGHCLYIDQATGLWDDENNLCYRIGQYGFNQTVGPQIASQQNLAKNNIFAYIGAEGVITTATVSTAVAGVGDCSPGATVKQFDFMNNIVYQDHPPANCGTSAGQYCMQKPPGAEFFNPPNGSPTTIQNWTNNFYFLTTGGGFGSVNPAFFKETSGCGTPSTFSNFAAWQSFGEDAGSVVTTDPGFTAPTKCTSASLNWPYPTPGVCDDFSFLNGVGPNVSKFVKFNVNRATTSVPGNGFGSYSGSPIPHVIDTFLTATNPSANF